MFRTIRLIVGMVAFLLVFAGVVAPALSRVSSELQNAMVSGGALTGVIAKTETALFLGMPLLLLGGILVLGFVVATGLRGTSGR